MENTLGTRIAALRRAKELTQEEVAEQLNVSAQAVSKWENDQSCPDIMTLPALAALLGATTDALLSGEKQPEVQFIPAGQRKSIQEMMLRILVHSDHGERVRINVPMSLICAMLDSGVSPSSIVGNSAAQGVDFAQILRLVESGAIGKLMEIEVHDGTTVEILVE